MAGAVAEAAPACSRRSGREELIPYRGVQRDGVVVDVHCVVVAERQREVRVVAALARAWRHGSRIPRQRYINMLSLTHRDATRKRSGIVVNSVIRDLDFVPPGMHEDAATA